MFCHSHPYNVQNQIMGFTMRFETYQRYIARVLLFIFVVGTFLPQATASAQILFARPGAGISRLPIDVFAFDAPGFGDVVDAYNLANGNVYVSLDSLAHNSQLNTGDETDNTVGNAQWNLTSRVHLKGFAKTLTAAPASFFLGDGDGSGQYFSRVTAPNFTTVPSWVKLYQNIAGAAFYKNDTKSGTQYLEEWMVLVIRTGSNSIAHYFDHYGTRYTFYNDGEYADYIQNTYQLYRSYSATVSDLDGTAASSPKTQITYTSAGSGLVSQVKDEWGRTTDYVWNTTDKTLTAINYLKRPDGTYARTASFTYESKTLANATVVRVINQVTYTTYDALGGSLSRWIKFVNLVSGNRILIDKIQRQILDSTSLVEIDYTYDASNRLTTVIQTGMPNTTYAYTTAANGEAVVTVTQSEKVSTYQFYPDGSLHTKSIKDFNSVSTVTEYLNWAYLYYPNGSLYRVYGPSDRVDEYNYDAYGNISAKKVLAIVNSALTPIRSESFTYDLENRVTSEITASTSGTINVDASYSYNERELRHTYEVFFVGSTPFNAAVSRVTHVEVIDTALTYNLNKETFDSSGRLVTKERLASGQTQTINYAYFAANTTFAPHLPNVNWEAVSTLRSPATYQYGDLPSTQTIVGLLTTQLWYDDLGNPVWIRDQNALKNLSGSDIWRDTFVRYNGFNQTTWQAVRQGLDGLSWTWVAKEGSKFYGTGEIDWSWNGSRANVTNYAFFPVRQMLIVGDYKQL
jgi:hypothetical protein